jgi:hypothetical protein
VEAGPQIGIGAVEIVAPYNHSLFNIACQNFRPVKSIGKRFNEILYLGALDV